MMATGSLSETILTPAAVGSKESEAADESAVDAAEVLCDAAAAASLAGLSINESRDKEALAQGLFHLFRPAVDEVDSRVKAVRQSQLELRAHIDNLAEDLRRISDSRFVPIDLDAHVKKLVNVRRRVVVVSNLLQTVQERVNKVNYYVNREKTRRNRMVEETTTRIIQGEKEEEGARGGERGRRRRSEMDEKIDKEIEEKKSTQNS